jgi:signal transduction histidine kinase
MPDEASWIDQILKRPRTKDEMMKENARLLSELERAYSSMEVILQESSRETRMAYQDLEEKYRALEKLYRELSEKENLLIHLEKLSSIGRFVTELIHELRNPLSVILLQTQLAAMNEIPEDLEERVQVITGQVKRMTDLLGRFRSMVYGDEEDFRVFDLNPNLAECLELMELIKPKDLRIERTLYDRPLPVKGDPYQISQVFLNLAKNSFEAMKEQGDRLWVESLETSSEEVIRFTRENRPRLCQKEDRWQEILDATARFGVVRFVDQGTGIAGDRLEEIFQPFFSTKKKGSGSGLGLSICSDIAVRHDANLTVQSEPGKGATFQFIIPLQTEGSPPVSQARG